MRLQQQLAIIKRALPVLTNLKWEVVQNGNGQTITQNKPAIRDALGELATLPYFRDRVAALLTFHTFAVGGDEVILDPNSHNQWHAQLNPLLIGLRLVEEALKLAVPQADAHTLTFRLPETTSPGRRQ